MARCTARRPSPAEEADAVLGEGRRALHSGLNLLVRGDLSTTAVIVDALHADASMPVVTWTARNAADLPALEHGTIILHDVDHLSVSAQRALLTRLDDHSAQMRVVTIATSDLFALVSAGTFLDQLYYRLNTIVVDAVDWHCPGQG
jgi:hypothetical protein